jgi:hypothetical protein
VNEHGLTPKKYKIESEYGSNKSRYIELTENEIKKLSQNLPHYPFADKNGVSLLFHWHTPGNLQCGQSHIMDVRFLPEKKQNISLHSTLISNDGKIPLDVSLELPTEKIQHDFSKVSICSVPVKITVHNYSKNMECNFSISLQSPSVRTENNKAYNPFVWMGSTKIHKEDFKPNDKMEYEVQACFFTKGTFNLNQIYVDLFNKTIKKDQKFNFEDEQHLIIIE